MPAPANVADPALYARVVAEAKARYARYPSAYASAWAVQEYKRRGGRYRGPRSGDGVGRWMAEEWVQVLPFLDRGARVACGAPTQRTKACRPLRRISPRTPPTLPELIALHGRPTLRRLARAKNRDMSLRVDWVRARVTRPGTRPAKKKAAAPKRAAPKRPAKKKAAAPKRAAPKRAAPKRAAPKRVAPKRASPKRAAPKRAAPKRAAPPK